MLLTIDIGNTQTVFGLFRGEELAYQFRLSSHQDRTDDEYAVLLRELLLDAEIDTSDIQGGIISSVVPPLTPLWSHVCEKRFGFQPLIVGPGIKTGMPIRYDDPREVGADRIVNGVAAYARHPEGVIVVDFGTATTFDLVSPKGEYLGGAIAPGIQISSEALFRRASKLPRVDLTRPKTAVGKTTVQSMQSGILLGYASLVDGMVNRIREEIDFEPAVIGTGGLAEVIAEESSVLTRVDGMLTLEGLRLIYERNR